MSKDNITGIVLIAVILIGSSILFSPSKEEQQERQRQQEEQFEQKRILDSLTIAQGVSLDENQVMQTEQAPLVPEGVTEFVELDTLQQAKLQDMWAKFSNAAVGQEDFVTLENDLMRLKVGTKGGFIHSAELKKFRTFDQKPLVLFFGDNEEFQFQFSSNRRTISTSKLYFSPVYSDGRFEGQNEILVAQKDSLEFSMRLFSDIHTDESPSYIEFLYKLRGDDYMIDFDVNLVGMTDVIQSDLTILDLQWNLSFPRQEKSRGPELQNTTIYYKYATEKPDYLSESRDRSEILNAKVKWVSFKQQFFNVSLIAREAFENGSVEVKFAPETDEKYIKHGSIVLSLAYNPFANNSYGMNIFLGPNHFNTLKTYDLELERLIPLGWGIFGWINRLVIIPVFNTLNKLNLNYGIIILLLTILLKIILLPLAYKSHMSQAKMKLVKPEIEEIGKKYPKKEDAMKKQQATMALYKKAGANPMSGCLPMLLQLPILIAMFRFFPSSIELRQEAFLWADDLSTYDSIFNLPFTIPMYGSHVSLFTLLMAITTVIYTRMNSQMMSTGNQMPGMKMMMYIMPVMMLVFFNSFASSLSYYYFLTNIITFGQTFLFRYFVDENKLHRQIEENKKKPVKKSKWAERLEQIQKQQQAQKQRGKR